MQKHYANMLISPASDTAWKSVTDEIITTGRIVMIIGRVDTGKSTFCRHLASTAIERGLRTGIVDADVGQSWIGPPTTVGMKIFAKNPSHKILPSSIYFVGSITPGGHLLQTTVGVKRMVDAAISAGADLVIIDTTGLVDGGIGKALKSAKINLTKPDHIVCLQRASELEILIRGIETNRRCRIHRLEPSRGVRKKSQNSRRLYRQEQFQEYFSESVSQEIPFSQLRGQRTAFLNGRRANDKELQILSEIVNDQVLYAEWSFRGLFIVTRNEISKLTASRLCSHLSIDNLSTNTEQDFEQLLIALISDSGEAICLAIIEKIDFDRNVMTLKCKKDAIKMAKVAQFSNFRL